MLKTLIKIRLKGLVAKQIKSSKKKVGYGKIILLILLFAYVVVVFAGMFGLLFSSIINPLSLLGVRWLYFAIMSLMIIMFCFIGSVFVTHHEIYEGKDNELLLSMPISNRDILLSRVFTILILNYIYESLIALPALYVYITTIGMNVLQIAMFILMFITLPLFVLALSCLFGWILAHILVHIRQKNFMIIALYIGFMYFYFKIIYSIEGYIQWLLAHGQTIAHAIEKGLFPLYHLSIGLTQGQILSFLLYILCALIPFALVMYLLTQNFVKLATTKPKTKKIKYKAKPMHVNSLQKTLLIREIKHFTSNAMVMLNGSVGAIFSIIGMIGLLIYADDIQGFMLMIPEFNGMLVPILCMMGVSINSLNIISASSVSLEGNRLWIIKSLPIPTKDILHIKLYLHLLMCVPFGIMFSIVSSLVFRVDLLSMILVIIIPLIFTCFIAILGLLLNLWKPKFDWINETVCVKQSTPVMLTTLIALGLTFVICIAYAFLFIDMMSIHTYMYVASITFILLDLLLYYLLCTWGVQQFDNI